MAKLNGVKFNNVKSNNKGNDFKAKITRNTVAIVGEKGVVLCTNGSDMTNVFKGDSVVDTALEALIDLLETIPNNTDTLIDKPYRIVLPRVISGLATGSIIDWIRTGKVISTGEVLPQERLEGFAKVSAMLAVKYANVELVADRHASDDDKKVTAPAWEALKAEISNMIHGNSALVQPSVPVMSEEDKNRIAELKAKLAEAEDALLDAEDEETEAKLDKKIAKLQSMIARAIANAGGAEEETTKDATQVPSEIAHLFQ